MPADELLRADLADFTVRLSERLDALEAKAEEACRLALDALDLAGAATAAEDGLDFEPPTRW